MKRLLLAAMLVSALAEGAHASDAPVQAILRVGTAVPSESGYDVGVTAGGGLGVPVGSRGAVFGDFSWVALGEANTVFVSAQARVYETASQFGFTTVGVGLLAGDGTWIQEALGLGLGFGLQSSHGLLLEISLMAGLLEERTPFLFSLNVGWCGP